MRKFLVQEEKTGAKREALKSNQEGCLNESLINMLVAGVLQMYRSGRKSNPFSLFLSSFRQKALGRK
ncbi:hypothetical protein DesfrDRAFT_1773 [Solidesulfovibrio fructosivorans JJ]]|uniref:Uncharacterized protein n=1 Tax=Solidesulfovibrio fructosivorans JJ] TaxID=596151 RepID=E1JVX4_SOLFR|nr:hypothetical protein DesfrDRAFT_1773 [Solidesulfovibrio fructosivorans JJ]]